MLECVSRGELERAFAAVPQLDPASVLFTPNFAPRAEYEYALSLGVHVTMDNLHPLQRWPEIFRANYILLRNSSELSPGCFSTSTPPLNFPWGR